MFKNRLLNHLRVVGLLLFMIGVYASSDAQYLLFNDAQDFGNGVFQLTPDAPNTSGSAWYKVAQDIRENFSVSGQMLFGQGQDGADGIVFVMQNNCVNGGTIGGGIGYSGMPGLSLGVEFDTYQNIAGTGNQDNADPTFDHVAIMKNGNVSHLSADSNLLGPVQMHSTKTDVEDSLWYDYRIDWNAATEILNVYFDGDLRLSLPINLVDSIFGGDNVIYWGFTSATGGFYANNTVQIDPIEAFGIPSPAICFGDTAQVVLPVLNNIEVVSDAKPVYASSTEPGPFGPEYANDGLAGTRWASLQTDPQWIFVDLLDYYEVSSIEIQWETAAALEYEIQISNDSTIWTTIATVSDGVNGEFRTINFPPVRTQFVRILGLQRTTGYGYSIFEFDIYGVGEYSWSPATFISDVSSSQPFLYPPVTTVYTVKVPDKCNGPSDVDFTVYVDTLSADLGPDRTWCENDTVSWQPVINGAFGEVTYEWFPVASTDSVLNVFPAVADSFTVVITDTLGCKDTTSALSFLDQLPSEADAGFNDTICADSKMLNATAPVVGVGSWSSVSGNGSFVDSSSRLSELNGYPAPDTMFLEWGITNGVCPVSRDTVIVIRVPDLTIPAAGTDQVICIDSTQLEANTSTQVETAYWSTTSSTASIVDTINPISMVILADSGTHELIWTIENGVCPNLVDTVLITRQYVDTTSLPSLSADADTVCLGSEASIRLNQSDLGISWWSSTDGITWANLSSSDSAISKTLNVATFYTATVDRGACVDVALDTIIVHVETLARAGELSLSAPRVCIGDSIWVDAINNTMPFIWQDSISIHSWQDTAITNTRYNTNAMGAGGVRLIALGTYCPNDTSDVFYYEVEDSAIVELTASNTLICSGEEVTLTGSTNTMDWIWQASTEAGWTDLSETSLILSDSPLDTTTYRFIAQPEFCPADSLVLTVNVNQPVELGNIIAPSQACIGDMVTVVRENGTYDNWQWQDSTQTRNWNDLVGDDTITFIMAEEVRIRALLSTNGICPDDTAFSNLIVVATSPQVPEIALNRNEICSGESVEANVTSGAFLPQDWQISQEYGTWSDISESGSIWDSVFVNTTTSVVSYRVRAINSLSCGSAYSDSLEVLVYPVPTGAIESTIECALGEANLVFDGNEVSSINTWQVATDGGDWTNEGQAEAFDLSFDVYTQVRTIYSNGLSYGCGDTTAIVTMEPCEYVLPIELPNALTPNDDGFNDSFWVTNISFYPNNTLKIYNRWGDLVYKKEGYLNEWEGTHNGKLLPTGTYYYVLDLKDGSKEYTGHVSILE